MTAKNPDAWLPADGVAATWFADHKLKRVGWTYRSSLARGANDWTTVHWPKGTRHFRSETLRTGRFSHHDTRPEAEAAIYYSEAQP